MAASDSVQFLSLFESFAPAQLIEVSAKATLLLATSIVLCRVCRSTSAAVRHRILALTFLALLALPVCEWLLPTIRLPVVARVPAAVGPGVSRPAAQQASTRLRRDPPAQSTSSMHGDALAPVKTARIPNPDSLVGQVELMHSARQAGSWSRVVATLWATVSALVAFPLAVGIVLNRVRVQKATPLCDDDWPALLREAASKLKLRGDVRLFLSDGVATPLVCGIVRTCVVLPRTALTWTRAVKRHVLLHECAHARRGDVLIHLIARIACSLYWFHPLTWYALVRMRREREEAADDCVLAAGESAQAYASSLLCVARTACVSPILHLGAIPMSQLSKLEGRLASILDAHRDRSQITGKLSGVSALVTIVVLAGLAMVTASRPNLAADAEEPAREATSDEELPSQDEVILNILKLGGRVTRDEAAGNEVTGIAFRSRTILDEDLRHLKVFRNLKNLYLGRTLVGEEGLAHIVEITTLEELRLEGCVRATDAAMEHVAKLANLTSLSISDSSVTDAGLEKLRALKKLQTLELTGLPITDKGAIHLLELKELRLLFFCRRGDGRLRPSQVSEPMVEILKAALPDCTIMHETGDLEAALARRRLGAAEKEVEEEKRRRRNERGFHVTNREEAEAAIEAAFGLVFTTERNGEQVLFVDLANCHVSDVFVAHLAYFEDVGALDLSRTRISDDCVGHLAGLKELSVLRLIDTHVTDTGLASLTGLKKLRELWLEGPLITDRGLEHISQLTSLEELMLSETRITDDGIKQLTALKNLRKLWLWRTDISDEALAHLRQLSQLEYMDVSGTRVTKDGADSFAAAMPDCKVELWINARER